MVHLTEVGDDEGYFWLELEKKENLAVPANET